MSMKAELVRDLAGFSGTAKLWRVDGGEHCFVITSAAITYSGPETYVFPANESGDVTDWGELEGSFRGDPDHDRAINDYVESLDVAK